MRRFTAEHISCEQVSCEPVWEGREEWRDGGRGRPVPGSLPIPRSSPPFPAHAIILRSLPSARALRRWPTCTPNASGAVLTTFDMFSTLTSAGRATRISLERQSFYSPPVAARPKLAAKPASHRPRAQERDPSATTSGVPSHPPLPQDVHDPRSGDVGKSQVEAIVIPSDDEFDLDGRSDTSSFESLGGLLSEARNTVQPGRISGTGMCLDLAFLGRPIC
jgi:hypothetical protein